MYFNKKYQERASAQSEFEKEIEPGIDNRIQADHEDSSNHDDYGGPQHTQQEFYDLNEELERFELYNIYDDFVIAVGLRRVMESLSMIITVTQSWSC